MVTVIDSVPAPGPRTAWELYRRWVLANTWAEGVGLGTTLLLGRAAAPLLDRSGGPAPVLLGAVAAVVLGVVLEGTVVGAAQELVLRRALPELRPRTWTFATMLGAGLAWVLGMVPSTIATLSSTPGVPSAPSEPPAVLRYGLAVLLGLITGPILGGAQWLVLRRYSRQARRWLWANAAAWAVGMPLIFAGMELVPWERGGVRVAAAIYAVCAVAGTGVGAIHGRVLLRLLRPRLPATPPA